MMIRKAILITLLTFSFTIAMCQVSFGIKGGVNLNGVAASIDQNPEIRASSGYHVGMFSRMKLSNKFSFIPELQYIQKGFEIFDNNTSEAVRIKINYLEMPVMLSYRPLQLLSIDLGPTVGLRVGDEMLYGTGKNTIDYRNFEFGVTAGLRFNVNEKLSISGRYFYGLTAVGAIFFTENGIDGYTQEMFNRNIQGSVYYVLK